MIKIVVEDVGGAVYLYPREGFKIFHAENYVTINDEFGEFVATFYLPRSVVVRDVV